jgi:hypothetical protein
MMMHHDEQPLYTRGSDYGLLNQARILRKAGAISLQVLMITPATGARFYEDAFRDGRVYASAGGRPVEPYMFDANHVVASEHPQPWRKQLNLMAAYLYFYNPLRLLIALVRPKGKWYLTDGLMQIVGMLGLVQTIRRTSGWAWCLLRGDIRRQTRVPRSTLPIHAVNGGRADHALPELPEGEREAAAPPAVTRRGRDESGAVEAAAAGEMSPLQADPAT